MEEQNEKKRCGNCDKCKCPKEVPVLAPETVFEDVDESGDNEDGGSSSTNNND